MAITANAVFEVRPTNGSDTNGGGFVWGTDWVSLSSKTDLAVDGSVNTKVSSTGYGFTSADVNRFIKITAGTGFTQGIYQILSVAAGSATLDRSPAAVSTGSGSFTIYNGIDYSQQNSANTGLAGDNSTTNAVANGTTTITSSTAAFTADIVGNIIYLQGGTGLLAAGWYEVKTRTSATAIVVDRTVATGTGITMNIGGALKTLAKAAALIPASANARVWMKAEATQTTAASIAFNTSSTGGYTLHVIGYTTTRGDNGQVTLQASAGLGTTGIVNATGNQQTWQNFIFDANSQTTTAAFRCNVNYIALYNCKVMNATSNGFSLDAFGGVLVNCEATACSGTAAVNTNGSEGISIIGNYIHDNTCLAIDSLGFDGVVAFNILYNNSGATSDGVTISANGCQVLFNTLDSCGRHGINFSGDYRCVMWGNLITNCGRSTGTNAAAAYGIDGSFLSPASPMFDGNAYYNNLTGNRFQMDDEGTSVGFTASNNASSPYRSVKDVALSASPYTNAPTDWSLNKTASGGAACRSAALPTTWPALGSTVGAPSFGAVQPSAAAAGMLYTPGMAGGMDA